MSAHLNVTLGFHLYVQHSAARKKLLKDASVIQAVEITPEFVFAGHGSVQHDSNESHGEQCIRYDSYLIPENHDLSDAIKFAYGGSTALCQQAKDSAEHPCMMHVSRRSSESEGSESELFFFMLEAGKLPENEYAMK